MNWLDHLAVILVFFAITSLQPTSYDLCMMVCANFIDVDHLLSKPIYQPGRNSFKAHVFHRAWKVVLGISVLMSFTPFFYFGLGLILHLLCDLIDIHKENILFVHNGNTYSF